jgi:protein required for attachment to host cells
MDSTWIVTANASRARVFAQQTASAALREIDNMVNERVRLRTVDTESDELGQRSASKSGHSVGAATTPNGYEPHQTPAEHETERFARDVAESLRKAYNQHRFRDLCLIASPEFLGVLRKLLDHQVASSVRMEINKDYTQLTGGELKEQIAARKH